MPSSKSSVDHRDVYYRLGKSAGYRARSAYKLLHLDEEFGLFDGVETAVDLCAAPGSWSQVLGQKLKPGNGQDQPKVVSIDLQPMAPLPNITILHTDITLPSTIPLVLDALGGRKADLVVCDGAPDVTGVHDLDAYLHSQLLLAALTLSLTLLAPHATLIFKIFLSPLDPQASILRSQLEVFFCGPPGKPGNYEEFDAEEDSEEATQREISNTSSSGTQKGYDIQGRRGGVWVRKPRSSRKGSGEAFIVCRNFDSSKVPLPVTYPRDALAELAKQTSGTLTLDSLSGLVSQSGETSREWDVIKAYVGSGNLDATKVDPPENDHPVPRVYTTKDNPPPPMSLSLNTSNFPSRASSLRSLRAVQGQPTPCDEPDEFFVPQSVSTNDEILIPNRPHLDSISRRSNSVRRAAALVIESSMTRQVSRDSIPSSSPASPGFAFPGSPWDRNPSPVPTPRKLKSTDSHDIAPGYSPHVDGGVSPSLSTGSKTDLFFASDQSEDLPMPPIPLSKVPSIGRGWPGRLKGRDHDRASSLPADATTRHDSPDLRSTGTMENLLGSPRLSPLACTHFEGSTSNIPPSPRITSKPFSAAPLSTLPTFPEQPMTSSNRVPLPRSASHHLSREQREGPVDETSLNCGQLLVSTQDEAQWPSRSGCKSWRLISQLGEGAFSAVWSAEDVAEPIGKPPVITAIKLTSRVTCSSNSRTRIAFLREVSVLRHISHPNIVSFLSSFSTVSHHCLVVERLSGGELFDLVANDSNRKRMLLPGPNDATGEGFIRRVFGELVRGVGWLHEVGVVHRDVKLENILLTVNPFQLPPTTTDSIPIGLLPSPLIKLTDFGLSRFINPASPLLQTRCGSESFAAPEIMTGRQYDGRQTDAWAMGVVLYALIVGELPFDGPVEGQTEREERKRMMMRVAKGQYQWPEEIGSESVRMTVGKLLVRDPKKRIKVADLWAEEWMRGPGEIVPPPQTDGVVVGDGLKRRRVLDGFLLDEEVSEVAQTETEL